MASLGIIIGLPVVALVLAALAVVFFLLHRWAKKYPKHDEHVTAIVLKWAAFAAAVIASIVTAFALWPYQWEYHSWQTTTGTVQTVSNRLVSTGEKSMEQRFVVAFTDGRQRSCDDSRCSLLRPGMTLTLRCKRAYQWGATPGYDCNYVDAR
jgi:hypothetical protein